MHLLSKLIDELLGRTSGCANGMGGSASIQSIEKKYFLVMMVLWEARFLLQSDIVTLHNQAHCGFLWETPQQKKTMSYEFIWDGRQQKSLPILFVVEDKQPYQY